MQWKMERVQTVPINISTTGAILEDLLKNIKLLGLSEHFCKSMQKVVLQLEASENLSRMVPHSHGSNNFERASTEFNPFDSY